MLMSFKSLSCAPSYDIDADEDASMVSSMTGMSTGTATTGTSKRKRVRHKSSTTQLTHSEIYTYWLNLHGACIYHRLWINECCFVLIVIHAVAFIILFGQPTVSIKYDNHSFGFNMHNMLVFVVAFCSTSTDWCQILITTHMRHTYLHLCVTIILYAGHLPAFIHFIRHLEQLLWNLFVMYIQFSFSYILCN